MCSLCYSGSHSALPEESGVFRMQVEHLHVHFLNPKCSSSTCPCMKQYLGWGNSMFKAPPRSHRRSTSWGWTLCRALSGDWRFQARPWSLPPPPVTHQHDFHWRPRAGGAPSGKNKQTWRPWECKCTDPAHLTLSEYGRRWREHVFDMRACVSVQSEC